MNKLAVILPIYKRHNLTRLCLEWLRLQADKFSFDVFVAGSEGLESENLVKDFGFNYIEVENSPLSSKLNALTEQCNGYDGVILIGSDDFISDSVFELYKSIDVSMPMLYGFDDAHVFCTQSNKLATGIPYGKKMTIGVGRMFTGKLLKDLDYKPWNKKLNRGLDTCVSNNLSEKGFEHVSLRYKGHFILDVKDDLNITHRSLVATCETIEKSIRIQDELGQIGSEILSLKPIFKIGYMKLLFEKNFPPYKAGDIVEFETKEELQVAGWVMANGLAQVHCECDKEHDENDRCENCKSKEEQEEDVKTDADTQEKPKTKAKSKQKGTE